MPQTDFVVEERFCSQTAEERRRSLQALMEQYVQRALQQPPRPASAPPGKEPP